MARYELDIYAIKQRIPEIMGMDLEWKRDGWQGGYYINGERHPYRKDKLKVRVWNGERGKMFWVHEEGGESWSLVNWLQRYGGASDWKEAMEILEGNCTPKRELLEMIRPKEGVYIGEAVLEEYKNYGLEGCNLFNWMSRLFGEDRVREIWERYGVTTDGYGNAVFWFRDMDGRICHDKRIAYQFNGRRNRQFGAMRKFKVVDGYSHKCFFGSHLVKEGSGRINVTESEKSCLLGALYYGGVWISCGGKGNLKDVDDNMFLYADMDCIDEWAQKGGVLVEWWMDEEAHGLGDKADIGDLIVKRKMKGL